MSKNKNIGSDQSSTSDDNAPRMVFPAKSRVSVKSAKLQINDNQILQEPNNRNVKSWRESEFSSSSKAKQPEFRKLPGRSPSYQTNKEASEKSDRTKILLKGVSLQEGKDFGKSDFIVRDCWRAASEEIKLVELFRETGVEESDSDIPMKKRKLDEDDFEKSPPYTKEFHLLTEVQKARILRVVEDSIKNLAHEDIIHMPQRGGEKPNQGICQQISGERFFCKKFLLPWVIVKVIEMVLCHIIQLTFLSGDAFFQRRKEFLPIVVTYYLTLFIVVISLVGHISCFSYSGVQNPCYFMGVISSSILTLTTSLGILIMLGSMEYYKSFLEILVLVFVAILLCSLLAELCLCYIEVRSIWNRVGQFDQYDVT